jgi:hypothetical protein
MKGLAGVMFAVLGIGGCQNADHDMSSVGGNSTAADQGQWLTLFDGSGLENFSMIGDANWHLADGYVEANDGDGFLLSRESYRNFHLRVEFWADQRANSGVFIRCTDPSDINGRSAYEVNIYDQRPDPTYRTGAITDVAPPKAQIDAANRWNTYEIDAEGPELRVRMNGVLMVEVRNNAHAEGPIALQYRSGTIRFRSVQIMPL